MSHRSTPRSPRSKSPSCHDENEEEEEGHRSRSRGLDEVERQAAEELEKASRSLRDVENGSPQKSFHSGRRSQHGTPSGRLVAPDQEYYVPDQVGGGSRSPSKYGDQQRSPARQSPPREGSPYVSRSQRESRAASPECVVGSPTRSGAPAMSDRELGPYSSPPRDASRGHSPPREASHFTNRSGAPMMSDRELGPYSSPPRDASRGHSPPREASQYMNRSQRESRAASPECVVGSPTRSGAPMMSSRELGPYSSPPRDASRGHSPPREASHFTNRSQRESRVPSPDFVVGSPNRSGAPMMSSRELGPYSSPPRDASRGQSPPREASHFTNRSIRDSRLPSPEFRQSSHLSETQADLRSPSECPPPSRSRQSILRESPHMTSRSQAASKSPLQFGRSESHPGGSMNVNFEPDHVSEVRSECPTLDRSRAALYGPQDSQLLSRSRVGSRTPLRGESQAGASVNVDFDPDRSGMQAECSAGASRQSSQLAGKMRSGIPCPDAAQLQHPLGQSPKEFSCRAAKGGLCHELAEDPYGRPVRPGTCSSKKGSETTGLPAAASSELPKFPECRAKICAPEPGLNIPQFHGKWKPPAPSPVKPPMASFQEGPEDDFDMSFTLQQLTHFGQGANSCKKCQIPGPEFDLGSCSRKAPTKMQMQQQQRSLPKRPELTRDEIRDLIQCETQDVDSTWHLLSEQKKTYKKPCPKQQKAQMTVRDIVHAHHAHKTEVCGKEYSPMIEPDPEDISPEVAAAMMFSQEQGVKLEGCPEETINHLFPDRQSQMKEPELQEKVPQSNVSIVDPAQKDQEEMIEKSAEVPEEGVSDSAYSRMKQRGEEPGSRQSYDLDFSLSQEKREYVLVPQRPERFNKIQYRGNLPPWFPGYFSSFPDEGPGLKVVASPSVVFNRAWASSDPGAMPSGDVTVLD